MDITKMHELFRTIGQQKGLQQVRAILPEEIDVYINSAIITKTRSLVVNNVNTVYNDKVTIQKNPISPINAIRTLYVVDEIDNITSKTIDLEIDNVMYYTSFSIKYADSKENYSARFIEHDKVDETNRDYCNRASWDYPIVTLKEDNILEIITNDDSKTIDKLVVRYIKMPTVVNYSNSISCDLPDYLHDEIVEIAVNKFFESIGSTSKQVN